MQAALKHEAPKGALATTPTAANLVASLREMLDCYWGEGDGEPAPQFIRQAQLLVENYAKETRQPAPKWKQELHRKRWPAKK